MTQSCMINVMFIDSHAHISSESFSDEAIEALLLRAKEAQVSSIINICTDLMTLERGLALTKTYPWVYCTASTTPHDVAKEGALHFPAIEEAARKGLLVAIGETGLDYHYEYSPKELQKEFLIRYLHLAKELKLPVVIHCRDAFEDLFEIFDKEYKNCPFVLHCFTGTPEEAMEVVKRGGYVSFSGIVTFKKSESLRESAKCVPLDHILIETDSPFLAPQSRRGKTNEPAFIQETASVIATLKGISLSELAMITTKNAKLFFSL